MTGSVPGFVDVVLNFDSKEVKEDNLLIQLERAGKQMIFYGDDTWIRLFPNVFARHDVTTSFYVADYTEVTVVIFHNRKCVLNQSRATQQRQ